MRTLCCVSTNFSSARIGLSLFGFSSFTAAGCARATVVTSATRTKLRIVRFRIELPPGVNLEGQSNTRFDTIRKPSYNPAAISLSKTRREKTRLFSLRLKISFVVVAIVSLSAGQLAALHGLHHDEGGGGPVDIE
jgi:hypothetical protein